MERDKKIELMQAVEERHREHLQRWLQNSYFRAALRRPAADKQQPEPAPRKVA
ncbi:hypothetical protein [Bosea sp. NPDC055594]